MVFSMASNCHSLATDELERSYSGAIELQPASTIAAAIGNSLTLRVKVRFEDKRFIIGKLIMAILQLLSTYSPRRLLTTYFASIIIVNSTTFWE